MKKIGNFQTEDPIRLSEQLDRFQEAVDQETSDIRASFLPMLAQRAFGPGTPIAATLASGQIGLCDSSLGNLNVTLAIDGLHPEPGWLAIVKRFAANNVTLKPSGMVSGIARRINATTTKVYAAAGLYWVYFDGRDWWG
jgi:hypothetical protein